MDRAATHKAHRSAATIAPESESQLDQSIKGHPNPASITAQNAAAFTEKPSITTHPKHVRSPSSSSNTPAIPKNILENHPTSPPTIYLNLLILEASLRVQYRKLHLRRRKYTVFLVLLALWTGFFFHAVYVIGPSPYSAVSTFQKLGLLGGVVTGLLFWMSGLYAKTMIWPRKLVGNVNKGLRVFNVKLVVVKGGFAQRLFGWMEVLVVRHPLGWHYALGWKRLPEGSVSSGPPALHKARRTSANSGTSGDLRRSLTPGTPPLGLPQFAHVTTSVAQRSRSSSITHNNSAETNFDPEDYLPSGSHVKLVIMSKGFSADFREGWELYRAEYWEKENERRQKEVEAIKTSLKQTNQLPPMTSSGVVVTSAVSTGSSPAVRGRPARGSSLSNSFDSSNIRPRSHSRTSTAELEESSSSSTATSKGRPRLKKKRSKTSLSGKDDLEQEGNSGTRKASPVLRRMAT